LQRKRVHRCLFLIAPAVACAGVAFSQAAMANKNLPAVGNAAPELLLTQVMQAPAGTKTDWAALRGKVIVLEFWATWCAPCIGEIPVLNALNASVDPSKVQIVSVDDEDPAVVQAFLKKKPISGWIGLDTSGKVFDRYGVYSRPETIIVGPDGRVASTTMRPESLNAANLLALANGAPLKPAAPNAATQSQLDQATAQAFSDQVSKSATTAGALFEISLTAAGHVEAGKEPETHLMMRGPGQMDVTNASATVLLNMALGIPATRITGAKEIDNALYNLHVEAPNAEPKQLASAVELAIATGAHLRIERQTAMKDAYVLTATPEAAGHLTHPPGGGAAFYSTKRQVLQCLNATLSQVAGGLEKALEMPVVDETGLDGMVMDTLKIAPTDVASANAALATLGLKLAAAKRPIETLTVTAEPFPAGAHAAN
jgi:cytochrome c biogenesis protein CcmG/thiol:disulfide interchange protein DsbE